MKAFVFIGPTISADEARKVIDAVCLPPAALGDVYRVARMQPRAIGLVDGFFEQVPAVWHKEILWAIAQGVDVFGSSSLGALRAAELWEFGMVGVGRIFEWYRDGAIEDDDEVALVHGPAERAFAPASEPMVNVRATLADAERRGVVSASTAALLIDAAKNLYYADRIYPTVLAQGRKAGASGSELIALERWLPTGRVDQKRLDAIDLLTSMRNRLAASQTGKAATFTFERTVFWQRLERSVGVADVQNGADIVRITPAELLDELRLDPLLYHRTRNDVILRELALDEGLREGLAVTDEDVLRALDELRERHHLADEAELERWQQENQLSRAELAVLLREEEVIKVVRRRVMLRALRRLADHLRLTGRFSSLLALAREKRAALAGHGTERPRPDDLGMTTDEVLEAYFKIVQPPGSDEAMAEWSMGLREICDDLSGALRSALRELRWRRLATGANDGRLSNEHDASPNGEE